MQFILVFLLPRDHTGRHVKGILEEHCEGHCGTLERTNPKGGKKKNWEMFGEHAESTERAQLEC